MPAAYVEEQAAAPPPPPPPAVSAPAQNGVRKPPPPQPPAKRPIAAKKPASLQPRDSGMSLGANGGGSADGSRSNTPTPGLAGSLADALKARQNAMSAKKDDEEDW